MECCGRHCAKWKLAARLGIYSLCLFIALAIGYMLGKYAPGFPASNPLSKLWQTAATLPTTLPASMPAVPGFARVSDTLYRGAQPAEEGFAQLQKLGIKTVVSLRYLESDQEDIEGLGLRYVHLHFNPFHPEEEDVVDFLNVVTDPDNQPVFVHCRQGVDRTGMMVAIYRVVVQDWPRQQAIDEMKALGSHEVWKDIQQYMQDFDAQKIKRLMSSAKPVKVKVVP
jgi:tyrosine-protein phosphatase SIW14